VLGMLCRAMGGRRYTLGASCLSAHGSARRPPIPRVRLACAVRSASPVSRDIRRKSDGVRRTNFAGIGRDEPPKAAVAAFAAGIRTIPPGRPRTPSDYQNAQRPSGDRRSQSVARIAALAEAAESPQPRWTDATARHRAACAHESWTRTTVTSGRVIARARLCIPGAVSDSSTCNTWLCWQRPPQPGAGERPPMTGASSVVSRHRLR